MYWFFTPSDSDEGNIIIKPPTHPPPPPSAATIPTSTWSELYYGPPAPVATQEVKLCYSDHGALMVVQVDGVNKAQKLEDK